LRIVIFSFAKVATIRNVHSEKSGAGELAMKRILKIAAIVVGAIIVIAIAIPFFVDANTFRPKLESEMSEALGRETKVGNLSLSLFSGAVKADNISIADDPAFSKSPFVQAKSLKVGVEIMPLIFSKALHVTEITLNDPEISLVHSEDGSRWNFSSLGSKGSAEPSQPKASATPSSSSDTPDVTIAKFNVNNGRLTVARAGSGSPHVYDKVNVEVKNLSLTASFPFKVSADLPAGGSLQLDGNAGPVNAGNAEFTPLNAKVTVKQMNLAASGFIDPASGIAGIADFDGTVTSDGHDAKTNGTLKVAKLQVAAKGSPATEPVQVIYSVTYDLAKQSGEVTKCDVAMGKAIAHVNGTYDAHGKVTDINMKLNGPGMPVDDLEAMLPALGVALPPKSQLKGGTLDTNFNIVGPVDKLVTTGSIKLANSALAGFNLGSKLSTIPSLAGKGGGSNDTAIQNFSSDVRVAPEGTKADNINLNIPSIGVLTGDGTVSPANDLAFKMTADLAGLKIPFSVAGTTADPKFTPDMKGMATGLLKNGISGQKNPASGVMGMFNKKK
jgi:AsmA protein